MNDSLYRRLFLTLIQDPIDPQANHTISLRSAIVAGNRRLILTADYSQVELRLLAHLSEDVNLREALNGGEDVFKSIASKIYSIPVADVDNTLRQEAKQV